VRRYVDLNLSNAELAGFARSLGWDEALATKIISLKSEKDLNSLFSSKQEGMFSVESEDADFLKRALKSKKRFLINPCLAKDFHRDRVLVRAASEAGVAFEIPVNGFLNSSFVQRAKVITQLSSFLRMCIKFKAGYALTSRATSKWDVKSPREVIAIVQLFGLNYEQAAYAISEAPGKMLEWPAD
jgi:ribonuclease P/MRP protein subunit RPP1